MGGGGGGGGSSLMSNIVPSCIPGFHSDALVFAPSSLYTQVACGARGCSSRRQ